MLNSILNAAAGVAGYNDAYYLQQAILNGNVKQAKIHFDKVDNDTLNKNNYLELILRLPSDKNDVKKALFTMLCERIDLNQISLPTKLPNMYFLLEFNDFATKQALVAKSTFDSVKLLDDPKFNEHIVDYLRIRPKSAQKIFDAAVEKGNFAQAITIYETLTQQKIEIPAEIVKTLTENIISCYLANSEFAMLFATQADKALFVNMDAFEKLCMQKDGIEPIFLNTMLQFQGLKDHDNLLVDLLPQIKGKGALNIILTHPTYKPTEFQLNAILNHLLTKPDINFAALKSVLTHISDNKIELGFTVDNHMGLKLLDSVNSVELNAIPVITQLIKNNLLDPNTEITRVNGGYFNMVFGKGNSKLSIAEAAINAQDSNWIAACIMHPKFKGFDNVEQNYQAVKLLAENLDMHANSLEKLIQNEASLLLLFALDDDKREACFKEITFTPQQRAILTQHAILHKETTIELKTNEVVFGDKEVKAWIDVSVLPNIQFITQMANVDLQTQADLLNMAIVKDNLEAVKYLLENNKDLLEQQDSKKKVTPYAQAEILGNKNISKYLVKEGANVNVTIEYVKKTKGYVWGEYISADAKHPIKQAFLNQDVETFKSIYNSKSFNFKDASVPGKESVLTLAIELNKVDNTLLDDFLSKKLFSEEQYTEALTREANNMEVVKHLLRHYPENKPPLPANLLQSVYAKQDWDAMELLLKTGQIASNAQVSTYKMGGFNIQSNYLLNELLKQPTCLKAFCNNLNINAPFTEAEKKVMVAALSTVNMESFNILINAVKNNRDKLMHSYPEDMRDVAFARFMQLITTTMVNNDNSDMKKIEYLYTNFANEIGQTKELGLTHLYKNNYERFKWLVDNKKVHDDDVRKLNENLTKQDFIDEPTKLTYLCQNGLVGAGIKNTLKDLDILSMPTAAIFKVVVKNKLLNLVYSDDKETQIRVSQSSGNNILHLVAAMNNGDLLAKVLNEKDADKLLSHKNKGGLTPVETLIIASIVPIVPAELSEEEKEQRHKENAERTKNFQKNLEKMLDHKKHTFENPTATLLLAYQANKDLARTIISSANFVPHTTKAVSDIFAFIADNEFIPGNKNAQMLKDLVADLKHKENHLVILGSQLVALTGAYNKLPADSKKRATFEAMIIEVANGLPVAELNTPRFIGGSTNGPTYLSMFCSIGAHQVLDKFLEIKGLDVNKAGHQDGKELPAPIFALYQEYLDTQKDENKNSDKEKGLKNALLKMVNHEKIDLNKKFSENGHTILTLACENGDLDLVNTLIKLPKVDLEASNSLKQTPLMLAIMNGNQELVETLLQNETIKKSINDADIREGDNKHNNTALLYAYATGNEKIIDLLEKNGAETPNIASQRTLLMAAMLSKNPVVIEKAFAQTKDFNAKDIDGNTALHTAIIAKNELGIEKLLTKSFSLNLDVQNKDGRTPLMLAVLAGDKKVVQELIKQGVDLNLADSKGNTALHYACALGDPEIVQSLCQPGIEHKENDLKATPFMMAMAANAANMAQQLSSKKEGDPVEEVGIQPNMKQIMDILLVSGANPHTTERDQALWKKLVQDAITYGTIQVGIELSTRAASMMGVPLMNQARALGSFANTVNLAMNVGNSVSGSVTDKITDYLNKNTDRDATIDYENKLLVGAHKISRFGFVSSNIADMTTATTKYKNVDKAITFDAASGTLKGLGSTKLQADLFHKQLTHQYYQIQNRLDNEWMLPWTRAGLNRVAKEIMAADDTLLAVPKSNDSAGGDKFAQACPQLAYALSHPANTIKAMNNNPELKAKMVTLVQDIIDDKIITSAKEKYDALKLRNMMKKEELFNQSPTFFGKIGRFFTSALGANTISSALTENVDGFTASATKWKQQISDEVALQPAAKVEKPSMFESLVNNIASLTGKSSHEVVGGIANVAGKTSGMASSLGVMAASYPNHTAMIAAALPTASGLVMAAIPIIAPIAVVGAGAALIANNMEPISNALTGLLNPIKLLVFGDNISLDQSQTLQDQNRLDKLVEQQHNITSDLSSVDDLHASIDLNFPAKGFGIVKGSY